MISCPFTASKSYLQQGPINSIFQSTESYGGQCAPRFLLNHKHGKPSLALRMSNVFKVTMIVQISGWNKWSMCHWAPHFPPSSNAVSIHRSLPALLFSWLISLPASKMIAFYAPLVKQCGCPMWGWSWDGSKCFQPPALINVSNVQLCVPLACLEFSFQDEAQRGSTRRSPASVL